MRATLLDMWRTMKFINTETKIQVNIEGAIIRQMEELCKDSRNKETGGILIGYYTSDLKKIVITEVTGPPPDSKKGWAWFYRGIQGLKELLINRWKNKEYYVGEWHFHPNNNANPSLQDIQQIKDIAKSKRFNCPEPLLLIISGNNNLYKMTTHIYFNGKVASFKGIQSV